MLSLDLAELARNPGRRVSLGAVEDGDPECAPVPRKFHGACGLFPWHPLFVVFGGWRVSRHFDDLWVGALARDPADLEDYAEVEPLATHRIPDIPQDIPCRQS
jgi:hypothetical protein